MAQMEAPVQAQAQEMEDDQAGPLLLERLQVLTRSLLLTCFKYELGHFMGKEILTSEVKI